MFERFRRRATTVLAPANVPPGWDTDDGWRRWEPPSTLIVGESYYRDALGDLAGPPRDGGYLIPVAVRVIREPDNRHDANAFRAEVGNRQVGHLARHVAAQLAPPLDGAGCETFTVCGVIRGGSMGAPSLGVHAWLDRRLTPGPEIILRDRAGLVTSWPPRGDEGQGGQAHQTDRETAEPGSVRGKHFTEYVDEVKALRRDGHDREAEQLLLQLVQATESESRATGQGVAPWYYEQLAIIYSKRKEPRQEIAILERFARQQHAPGVMPRLLERLAKRKGQRGKEEEADS